MLLKKSELYTALGQSCDELRGGMDASEYKDYVQVLLFVKKVSDNYTGRRDALIEVPPGGSFADMVAARGDKEIGDRLNKIIGRLAARTRRRRQHRPHPARAADRALLRCRAGRDLGARDRARGTGAPDQGGGGRTGR